MGTKVNQFRWWLKILAICIGLGVTTCVAVAWGLAWSVPVPLMVHPNIGYKPIVNKPGPNRRDWYAMWEWRFGYQLIMMSPSWSDSDPKERARELSAFEKHVSDRISRAAIARHESLLVDFRGFDTQIIVLKAGWPFLCLGYEKSLAGDVTVRTSGDSMVLVPVDTTSHPSGLSPYYSALELGERRLPIGPIWKGLIANVAIYTCAWLMLVGGYFLTRHLRRKARGLCLHCGYSRQGLALETKCPECGEIEQPSARI